MKNYNDSDKEKYKKDLPDIGTLNWVSVKLKNVGEYDGIKRVGILLHDNKLLVSGILFEETEFDIINNDPLGLNKS